MGQMQETNDGKRGPDATGSPHNLNDQKNRANAKNFGDRTSVNPMLKGGGGKARAGATHPLDKEKPR